MPLASLVGVRIACRMSMNSANVRIESLSHFLNNYCYPSHSSCRLYIFFLRTALPVYDPMQPWLSAFRANQGRAAGIKLQKQEALRVQMKSKIKS